MTDPLPTPVSTPLSSRARAAAAGVALCATAAYGLQMYDTLLRHPDRALWAELWRQARYFTYLTDLVVAAAFVRIAQTGSVTSGWAAGLTLWSVTVGAVYHGLLARDLDGLRWWADQGLHTLVPAAVAAWWAVFAPKADLHRSHPGRWLAWPGLYAVYALLRGEIDGRHPYFFLDPPLSGWAEVAMWCLILGVGFWVAGAGLVALGRRLSARPGRQGNAGPGGLRPR